MVHLKACSYRVQTKTSWFTYMTWSETVLNKIALSPHSTLVKRMMLTLPLCVFLTRSYPRPSTLGLSPLHYLWRDCAPDNLLLE